MNVDTYYETLAVTFCSPPSLITPPDLLTAHSKAQRLPIIILLLYGSTPVFITQGNYVGYMFRLMNSNLQACSLQLKSQGAVHTLGSQCVYVSQILKPYHLPRRVKRANDMA